jgi:hypothetical protein
MVSARRSGQAASNTAVAVGGGNVGDAVGEEVGDEAGIVAVGVGGKTTFCTKAQAIVVAKINRVRYILELDVIAKCFLVVIVFIKSVPKQNA